MTTQWVRRMPVVWAVLAVFALGGCASGDNSTTSATTVIPSAEQLRPMLLTVSDMPSGWVVDPSGSIDSKGLVSAGCFGDLQSLGTRDTAHEAAVAFQEGSVGRSAINESIAPITAGEFDSAVAAVDACTEVQLDVAGQTVRGSIRPLPIPAAGDESAAWRLSFEVGGTAFTSDMWASRVGEIGVLLVAIDAGGGDPGFLADMTTKAAEKIAAR